MFLESAPDIRVSLDCDGGETALDALKHATCDVILLDLVLRRGMDGVTTFNRIRETWPHMAIIILTSYQDPTSLSYLQSHGASGYLDKTISPDDLLQAIRLVARGHSVWDPTPKLPSPTLLEPLTSRETHVLQLLAEGLSNKEIGSRLAISEKTVKVHVSHILGKLNVYDRTQAVISAHQRGLVHLSTNS